MRARQGQDRPDPVGGTPACRDLEDVLRRALHAAVDAVEPADDGLTRIMRRLTTPSVVRQVTLLGTDCMDLARLISIWLEPAFTGAARLGRRHHGWFRSGPSYQPARAPLRPGVPWLRPALAVAGAVTILAMGVVVLGQVRQIVTRTSLNADTGASAPAHAGAHSGSGHGGRSPMTGLTQTAPARPGTTPAHPGRTPHHPRVTPSGSPAASPSQSPAPTPTPSKTNHGHHKPHPTKPPHPGPT